MQCAGLSCRERHGLVGRETSPVIDRRSGGPRRFGVKGEAIARAAILGEQHFTRLRAAPLAGVPEPLEPWENDCGDRE